MPRGRFLNMSKIEIYITDFCPYCTAATRLLDKLGVEYTEIDLGRDPEGRMELAERTGLMTFPQIVVDGETLGGYDQLKAAVESGRFDELIAAK